LYEFAEHQFGLNKPDQNGITLREHLEQVERQTGKTLEELQGPEFPFPLSNIWSAFIDLSSTRGQGFSGPLHITYNEIKAYMELTGTELRPWEVEVIKGLDRVYMKVANG